MRIFLSLLFLFIYSINANASAPTRPNSYVAGTVIDPTAVTANEVALYTYLQSGVDTYSAGSIANSSISNTAAIAYSKLSLSNSIQNSDISTSAAIAYSKLSLSNSIQNSDISSSAAIDGSKLANVNPTLLTNIPYIKVTNTQTVGNGGGNATTGSWQTATLNTKDNDTGAIATLSTNTLTLPAGTYQVRGIMPFYSGAGFTGQIRLLNSTDSTPILIGESMVSSSDLVVNIPVMGQFTLAGTKNVILQYQATAASTNAQGKPASISTEVYAQLEFWKIS